MFQYFTTNCCITLRLSFFSTEKVWISTRYISIQRSLPQVEDIVVCELQYLVQCNYILHCNYYVHGYNNNYKSVECIFKMILHFSKQTLIFRYNLHRNQELTNNQETFFILLNVEMCKKILRWYFLCTTTCIVTSVADSKWTIHYILCCP